MRNVHRTPYTVHRALRRQRIGLLGLGTMGSAIARGLLAVGVSRARLCGAEARPAQRRGVSRALRIRIVADVAGVVRRSDVVLLAVKPQELGPVLAAVRATHLVWRGLMTIAPAADDPDTARPVFRRLRELHDRLQQSLGVERRLELSMGMSHDFTVAVEEGADLVRIGSAIFEEHFWDA